MSPLLPAVAIVTLLGALGIAAASKKKRGDSPGDSFPNQTGEVQDAIDAAIKKGDVTALEVIADMIAADDPEGARRLRDIAEKLEGGQPPTLNPQLVQRIVEAVASQDPVKMQILAAELKALGFVVQAESLLAEAKKVAKGDTVITSPGQPQAPVTVAPELVKPTPSIKPLPLDVQRVYTVVDGDSAIKITRKFLGSGQDNRYKELLKANPKKKQVKDKFGNPNFATLFAGERLDLPSSWPDKPGSVTVSTTTKPADVAPSVKAFGGSYVVLPGDFPIRITRKFLGPGTDARYKELLRANPQKTLNAEKSNFKFLVANEKLNLPGDWPSAPQF